MPHDSSPPDPLAIAHETIVSAGNILAAAGFSRMEIAAAFRQAADQLAPAAPPPAEAREAEPARQAGPADAILAEFARIAPLRTLTDWLAALPARAEGARVLLSLREPGPLPAAAALRELTALSGPEGGLSDAEESAAGLRGFMPVSLGPRTLRADTAPLALLAHLALTSEGSS